MSGHQSVKQLGIDVAARQDGDDDLALYVDAAREQRRKPDGAARLDHQLQLAEREGDRAADFLVAGRDAFADQRAVVNERAVSSKPSGSAV